ncbi:MAG TPA: response regulator [Bacteroidales bacterium]|nr:response regulator [Bacteroidales bacterium]HRZ49050.1 response regulator [Bacteroidales bacterium]
MTDPNTPDWKDKLILVVEDNYSNYRLLELALRKTNAKLHWAKNGQEAISLCREVQDIDLILMDIQMPVMDGYETTAQVKILRPEIPIVAQTSYSMTGDREKSIEAGCIDHIPKPIIISDLITILAKYISRND